MNRKKIIIRTPNWLGDSIMSLKTIYNLMNFYKKSEIFILTKQGLKEFFRIFTPGLKILSCDFQDKKAKKKLIMQLKELKLDIGIIFPLSFSSAHIFKKAKIQKIVGFNSEIRGVFLTDKVPFKKNNFRSIHLSDRFTEIYSFLSGVNPEKLSNIYNIDSETSEECLKKFSLPDKRFFIISPGATYGPAKRWSFSNFIDVGKYIQKKYLFTPVLIGFSNEIEINTEIPESFINLIDKTNLEELIILTSESKFFITNDSGPMHIADALRIPLVAIFGSTSPTWTGPRGNKSRYVESNLDCKPCFRKKCKFNYICMHKITSNEVIIKVNELLEGKKL
ncbi:lipopolysaccharide heptosyltransferase II [Candidatus Dependentiae bacterium]|nr:lipopolysaccharide heptosyltransferase II [Candidatus Dependentiae bacterium]